MPTIEEVEDYDDIDNLEMDLAELDSSLKTPIAPKVVPTVVRSQDQHEQSLSSQGSVANNSNQIRFINPETGEVDSSTQLSKEEMDEFKGFQLIYPCYFDKNRSHKEGRRAPLSLSVDNPLAKTIADAVRSFGLLCIFEGEKSHPQDFGNPGRVRVLLKEKGKLVASARGFAGGKKQLINNIGEYLKKHPTKIESLREIPYGPDFDGVEFKKIPLVNGFRMNEIVPLHSPFLMGHPMTKSIYEALPTVNAPEKHSKAPKNKYKVIRR